MFCHKLMGAVSRLRGSQKQETVARWSRAGHQLGVSGPQSGLKHDWRWACPPCAADRTSHAVGGSRCRLDDAGPKPEQARRAGFRLLDSWTRRSVAAQSRCEHQRPSKVERAVPPVGGKTQPENFRKITGRIRLLFARDSCLAKPS